MFINCFYKLFKIIPVDCMLRKEALVLLANLSQLMAEKWRNPFGTCKSGLLVRLQSRSRNITPVLSVELVYPVPCGVGSRTGNRVWVWDWHNKSRARIIFHTPAETYSVSYPTSYFSPFLNCTINASYTQMTDEDILWRIKHGQ